MRKAIVVLTAALAVLGSTSPSLVLAAQGEKPTATAGSSTSKAVKDQHLSGEVVAVDQQAKTVTIRTAWKKPKEFTFSVEDKAVAALADLKPGDWLNATYIRENGKLTAETLVKAQRTSKK